MKNLKINDMAHTMLKVYCAEKDKKIYEFASLLIIEELLKRKENELQKNMSKS